MANPQNINTRKAGVQTKRFAKASSRVRFSSSTPRKSAVPKKHNAKTRASPDAQECESDSVVEEKSQTGEVESQFDDEEVPSADDDPFEYVGPATLDQTRGTLCELHSYDSRHNSKGDQVTLRTGTKYALEDDEEKSSEAALVFTRNFYSGLQICTHLEIRSPFIKTALREVIGSYPGIGIDSERSVILYGKPECLFHYRQELEDYAMAHDDPRMKEHVLFCLRYMRKALRNEISAYDSTMLGNRSVPGLDFPNLWMAFKPGTMIYVKPKEHSESIRKCVRIDKMKDDGESKLRWEVELDRIECDGKVFGYTRACFNILHYAGYKALTELPVFPLQFHKEEESVREHLVARGRKYAALRGTHYRMYDGTAHISSAPESSDNGKEEYLAHHRIMIDAQEYYRTWKRPIFEPDSVIDTESDEPAELSEDQLLVCYYRVPALSLVTKRWGMVDVQQIEDINFHSDTFAKLVLLQEKKEIIAALVRSWEKGAEGFDDLIKGKGKGLIFLLHGPPGVGKTFTAESIAELTQRPLYTVGSGELGLFRGTTEAQLSAALNLATKWGAVVLIDEMDVFMAERGENLPRNELVSVLLRVLEYFEGILFLTTNRVETIDPAFKSRIHLSIAYPHLSTNSKRDLWKTFVQQGSEQQQQQPAWLNDGFLNRIASLDMNGRQIKNTVRVAHALAQGQGRAILPEDIFSAARCMSSFDEDFRDQRVWGWKAWRTSGRLHWAFAASVFRSLYGSLFENKALCWIGRMMRRYKSE